jgi:hypothetical protein
VSKKETVKGTPSINRDVVLAASDRTIEMVEVPEWGGHLYVRNMTAAERVEYDRWNMGPDGPDLVGMRVKGVIMGACDEAGNRLFTTEDYPALLEKDGAVITRIFLVFRRISGIAPESLAEAIAKLKNSLASSSPTA